ncbi:MAG: hypothetical protein EP335_15875 [Alphaproteobacteria bacterium]|nr:MAG: hypothetical protein EP335_15875 [Alphaproteobacteria bacterium]
MKTVIVAIITAIAAVALARLSQTGRGKRRPRDYELIGRRLRGRGFGKWMVVDFVIYVLLVAVFFGAAFGLYWLVAMLAVPADVAYNGEDGLVVATLAALFVGIIAPGLVWVPYVKALHGRAWRKYVLFTMASQGMDSVRLMKVIVYPFAVLVLLAGLKAATMVNVIEGDMVRERGFLALGSTWHNLAEADDFLLVDRATAPNGNVIIRRRLVLHFPDGHVWESLGVSNDDFSERDLAALARHIGRFTHTEPRPEEFSPYD